MYHDPLQVACRIQLVWARLQLNTLSLLQEPTKFTQAPMVAAYKSRAKYDLSNCQCINAPIAEWLWTISLKRATRVRTRSTTKKFPQIFQDIFSLYLSFFLFISVSQPNTHITMCINNFFDWNTLQVKFLLKIGAPSPLSNFCHRAVGTLRTS